ncbi:MAG TPA: VOC family protein [Eoetvoesiella sp.]
MQVQTYLFFEGRCEEALEFYKRELGAEVTALMRYNEAPKPAEGEQQGDCQLPPGSDNKIMHCSFKVGDTTLLASDGRCSGHASFQGFSVAITAPDIGEAERLFAALSKGGQVQMPMAETFFASRFGMAADPFGVSWMVLAGK